MLFRRHTMGTLAAALFLLPAAAAADPVEFVVLGDIPYGQGQVGTLENIRIKIKEKAFPFVIDYGDVKGGGESCDLIPERRDLIYGLLPGKVFYTPGDNDWTDCDRPSAGGYDELTRLDMLRRIFYSQDLPSNPEWHIARQGPDYPENARWEYGRLQFATLHIVGTDNGRNEISKSDVPRALDAVDARDRANLTWLEAAFGSATARNAEGMVIVMHADPFDIEHRQYRDRPCTGQERQECNPYLAFLERLTERAGRFGRPVLLVHGSTSNYCLDRGFGGWRAGKLWRLNGPGDFIVIDAAVVTFDPHNRTPFAVRGLSTNDAAPECAAAGQPE